MRALTYQGPHDIARAGGRVSVVGVNQNMAFPLRMPLARPKEREFAPPGELARPEAAPWIVSCP